MTSIIALLIGILLGGFFAGGLVWCWLSDRFYFVNKQISGAVPLPKCASWPNESCFINPIKPTQPESRTPRRNSKK